MTARSDYIKGISQMVIVGEIDFTAFDTMTDHEIVKADNPKGVGIWTAEMLPFFLCKDRM